MTHLYKELRDSLTPRYGLREAQAIAFIVLETAFDISRTEVYADKVRHFSEEDAQRWQNISQRLVAGEPVQYVLGKTCFCGLEFQVTPATLIPRPETEELVAIAKELSPIAPRILDVGTGSGCIAVSLAHLLPHAYLEAWDISPGALTVAAENATANGATVRFLLKDVLQPDNAEHKFNLIVSNPPYIRESERKDMESHVLEHEPSTALFVPDDDALLFYRALADLSLKSLYPGGYLCVEINSALGTETARLFSDAGLEDIEIKKDMFGQPRFIVARYPQELKKPANFADATKKNSRI